jgi:hypothetical protein
MLQPKSADDWYGVTLKIRTQTYEYVDLFSFSVSFYFPYNLTRCRLGDFDMIFIIHLLNSNINYI